MPDEVFPVFSAAKALDEPETGWAGYLIWLSISPRTEGNVLDVSASAMLQPYRKLKDGTIEIAPERLRESFAIGSLREAKALPIGRDARFSAIVDEIMAVLRTALEKL